MMRVVIVGAGVAADGVLTGLHAAGFKGEVLLIGAERHLPYDRTALSKDLLSHERTVAELALHPAPWYSERGAKALLGAKAVEFCHPFL